MVSKCIKKRGEKHPAFNMKHNYVGEGNRIVARRDAKLRNIGFGEINQVSYACPLCDKCDYLHLPHSHGVLLYHPLSHS